LTEGVKAKKSDGYGGRFLRFRAALEQAAGGACITKVYYEEVHAHNGTRAAHIYGGMKAVLTAWCEENHIPYEGVGVGTIKRRATGKGNASKDEVKAAVEARGFRPATFDEADALALLLGVLELAAVPDLSDNVGSTCDTADEAA
jgi:Holliday junction resolvasome RuvABC endonuclease subunit